MIRLQGFGQEKSADMSITFAKEDDKDICQVKIVSEGKPVAELPVKLFVKRIFGNLQIGEEVSTDENGVASFEFPNDIPLNQKGILEVMSMVEDDENFGTIEANITSTIGIKKDLSAFEKIERSLSGKNAPIYFTVASLSVFIGVWLTILYVVLQVFKIRKSAVHLNH